VLGLLTATLLFAALRADPRCTVRVVGFERGKTIAALKGSIAPEAVDRYVLHAKAEQRVTVHLESADHAARFRLLEMAPEPGQDGELEFSSEATDWRGTLPDSMDYAIDVYTRGHGSEYTLEVRVQ
jgi:hypothetical protein